MQLWKWFARLAAAAGVATLGACGASTPPTHVTVNESSMLGQSSASGSSSAGASHSPTAPQSVKPCVSNTVRIIEPGQSGTNEDVQVNICIVNGKNVWVATEDAAVTNYRYLSQVALVTDGHGSNVKVTVPHGARVVYLTDLDVKNPMCGQDLGATVADHGVFTISLDTIAQTHHCAVIEPRIVP